MISAQIIRNCIEELRTITKVEFAVLDINGSVVAMTEGATQPDSHIISGFVQTPADSQTIGNCYLLKVMEDGEPMFVLAAIGDAEHTFMVSKIAVAELQNLMSAYKEKYDRNNFFQNLLLDNLLLVDIYNRAKKLHIESSISRAIIMIEIENSDELAETTASEMLSGLFTVQNGDYLTAVDESSVVLIKSLQAGEGYERLQEVATIAVDMLNTETMVKARAAFGTIVGELKDLSKSYKEAKMAMDVGKIFYAEKRVISYNALGIGRLIYQLPVNLCKMFIEEIFGDNVPYNLDPETLITINTFFDNNLNVSETSRQLFVHRNTLVYRIEKLQKLTGLDIRVFDDALTFKIALMVVNYMKYLDSIEY